MVQGGTVLNYYSITFGKTINHNARGLASEILKILLTKIAWHFEKIIARCVGGGGSPHWIDSILLQNLLEHSGSLRLSLSS